MSTHTPVPEKAKPGLQKSSAMLQAQTDDAPKQQEHHFHFAVFVSHLATSSCWSGESCETT